MARFTILYTLGLVLFSLHRCQSTFDTCSEIASCLKYTESELCDRQGRKTDVCISWEPSASCTAAIIDDGDLLEGVCAQDATTPVKDVGANSKVCAANPVSAGVEFHFGIQSTQTLSNADERITISGHVGKPDGDGKADCKGPVMVCGGSGTKDFKLTFTVGVCPEPCDSCSSWSNWGSCDATCGPAAMRSQTRTCPITCNEGTTQTAACLTESAIACPTACTCTDYGQWGTCSATCGSSATRSRYRTCSNCPANTPQSETGSCPGVPASCPVDGVWGGWNHWSACPATCGGHMQSRNRDCNNPAPAFNGKTCPAPSSQTQACGTANCPPGCNCSEWGVWTSCSQTCGTSGSRSRTRSCAGCSFATVPVQNDVCIGIPSKCPINGQWSHWSDWSTCIVTCGGANQSRTRTCNNPAPSFGGTDCPPPFEQTQVCGNTPCGTNRGNNNRNRSGNRRVNRSGRRRGGGRRRGRRGGPGNQGGVTQQCRQRASQGVCNRARAGRAKRSCIQRACS